MTLPNLASNNSGNYTLGVTNALGAVTSAVASVTVAYAPLFFDQEPQSQSAIVGNSVLFSANVSGALPISYQWFLNGSPLPNETTNKLYLSSVTTNNAGSYWLRASN